MIYIYGDHRVNTESFSRFLPHEILKTFNGMGLTI